MNYLTKAQKQLNRWQNLRPVLERHKKAQPLTPTESSFVLFEPEHDKSNNNEESKHIHKKRSNSIISDTYTSQQRNLNKRLQGGSNSQTVIDSDTNTELECNKKEDLKRKMNELRVKYSKAQGLNLELRKDITSLKKKVLEANEVTFFHYLDHKQYENYLN